MAKHKDQQLQLVTQASESRPLDGVQIAVIAPVRRQDDYTQELEKLGAIVHYAASEEKAGQVSRVCHKADAILFVTTFTSHKVDGIIRDIAASEMIPCKLVTTKGKDRLADEAIKLASLIPVFQEKRESTRDKAKKRA